jgi:hypothetical protein
MLSFRNKLVAYAVITVSVFAAILIDHHTLASARAEVARAAFAAANARALADTTRDVARDNKAIAAMLGDSLRMAQRQVQQVAQTRDSVDTALGLERTARYGAEASVDSLQQVLVASRSVSAGDSAKGAGETRHFTFALRQAPYTIAAHVEVPPSLDTARLSLQIALDSASVRVRLSCAKPNEHGVRAASIEAVTPAWVHVRLDAVEQAPELCASPALAPRAPGRPFVQFRKLMLGAGRIVPVNGTAGWGLFVGAGLAIGG